ncbi:hypothetical protein [Biformimicrobium ophioploci]|uniref:Uncharacterized protein n=1 Tax=Biformimicrobium ophioploci TaxID=3036711 RepID=A0ABQ6M3A0_9GAMM|nr:hypothetical protein [Microbulbifer sp. NKW57]GMG88762.1 hypothetical protein MNKW57_30830 [Microbulbifer sp. NKW57]
MSEKILSNIRENKYDRKELEKLLSNAERLGRKEIAVAVKESLKEVDSRSYSKRFVKPIRDKIKQIAHDIMENEGWGNWADNKVGNGVKTGGLMLNGEVLAEFYFSYRAPDWKSSSYLAVVQETEESAVHYTVKKRSEDTVKVFNSVEAIELFHSALKT